MRKGTQDKIQSQCVYSRVLTISLFLGSFSQHTIYYFENTNFNFKTQFFLKF